MELDPFNVISALLLGILAHLWFKLDDISKSLDAIVKHTYTTAERVTINAEDVITQLEAIRAELEYSNNATRAAEAEAKRRAELEAMGRTLLSGRGDDSPESEDEEPI